MTGLIRGLQRALQSVLDCVFPVACVGCGQLDTLVCARCTDCCADMVSFDCGGTLTGIGWACGTYTTALRRIILSWKDHGVQACTPFLASCFRRLVIDVAQHLYQENEGFLDISQSSPLLVIAVPSSPKSARKRGRKHMIPLANAVAQQLCECGIPARAVPILDMRYTRAKSVQTAGRASRQQRLAEHALFVRNAKKYKNSVCVLVDDIVTTGSTMRHCIAELESYHISTLTVVSLAKA